VDAQHELPRAVEEGQLLDLVSRCMHPSNPNIQNRVCQ
jgi:hypothetical protein